MTYQLTERDKKALIMVVQADRPLTADELGKALETKPRPAHRYYELGWQFTRPLVKAELLTKIAGSYRAGRPMSFAPTEKGRIAAALLIFKGPPDDAQRH